MKWILALVFMHTLCADTLPVLVWCNNGQPVPNLSITVVDFLGVAVAGVTSTDSQGNFQIENTENYTAPFYMSFTTSQGSICGQYSISVSENQGCVTLNYYPTCSPCSCSRLCE